MDLSRHAHRTLKRGFQPRRKSKSFHVSFRTFLTDQSQNHRRNPARLDARAQAKLRAALHEAGHFIAAKHFKVAEVSGLHPAGAGQFEGKTLYGSTAAFNEAVIGWCGPLAESRPGRTLKEWKDVSRVYWQLFTENKLSKEDTDLINRYADKRKTFERAVEIVAGAENEITQATASLFKQDSLFNFPWQSSQADTPLTMM